MTIPESITVSLDVARNLKEAGWPQGDSYFVHSTTGDGHSNHECHVRLGADHSNFNSPYYMQWDAPTAEEILRTFPAFIKQDGKDFWMKLNPMCRYLEGSQQLGWMVWYAADDDATLHMEEEGYSTADLVNAAAAMWIYLKQNNLLSPQPK